MPLAPGPLFRSSAEDTGTTSLSIALPAGVVDGDILIMCLSHLGAGFATVPGGWTLVAQEVSTVRGEMYWKRASGEVGPYSVTGMATSATGVILAFTNCVASGDPINAFTSRANAGGANSNGTPALTTTVANCMVVPMNAVNSTGSQVGFGVGRQGVDDFFSTCPELQDSIGSTARIDNANGAELSTGGAIKTQAGSTGAEIRATVVPNTTANVCIVAALAPDTAQTSASRYYFAGKTLNTPSRETYPLAGAWAESFAGMFESTGDPVVAISNLQLTQKKIRIGESSAATLGGGILHCNTHRQGNHDVLLGRWATPPLAAVTLSGTLDLCAAFMARWSDGPINGFDNSTVARIKLHAYISVGQTSAVRTTLINNYVDATNLPNTNQNQAVFVNLTAPQSLSGSVQAGDSIVIELGVRIVSAPTSFTQTYPPSYFSRINFVGIGPPTVTDVTAGFTVVSSASADLRLGYVDFTDTLVEQALPAAPANTTPETATVAVLPFSETPYDTSGALSNSKGVWYKFTATDTGDVIATALPSQGMVTLTAFEGPDSALVELYGGVGGNTANIKDWNNVLRSLSRPMSAIRFPVTEGTEYFVRVHSDTASEGCNVAVTLSYRDTTPQSGDIYFPCGYVVVYRDGVIVEITGDWSSSTPSGIAIDYTKRPITHQGTGVVNTGYRVYLGLFGLGAFVEILDLHNMSTPPAGQSAPDGEIDWIADPFELASGRTSDNIAQLHLTTGGVLVASFFGNGFLYVLGYGTTVTTAMNTVSDDADLSYTRRIDATHGDSQSGAPWPLAEEHATVPEVTSPWGIAVSEDGNTLYYTSGSFYIPVGGQVIKRWDLATNAALADFATLPVAPNPNPGLRSLSIIPAAFGGGLLVCSGGYVVRLDDAGAVVATHTPTLTDRPFLAADVHLTPDGTAYWVSDEWSASLVKMNLASGAQVETIETGLRIGTHTQFAILDLDEIPNIPPREAVTYNIRWLRRGPHLSHEQERIRYNSFQLDMQTGVGLPSGQGSDPKVMLRWSDDGGHTWSQEVWLTAGKQGKFKARAIARRLGKSRDRIFEVSGTDPVIIALLSAILKPARGTS